MSIQAYYEEIRQDIAHEFGLEAGGYAPQKGPELPIRIAQRILAKYPGEWRKLDPRALVISKRYMSIYGKYL
jgi:hypothetical protein